ncbi:hypothetical protein [Limnoglobus roseus]|uniref:hypothetical protein n=1 Tax=Limnoglobus roseus TaxID=2598579 RepID=UPI001FE76119|nr:hypothetical protein [Limnoglobus roseus]
MFLKLEKGDRDRLGADNYLRLCEALGVPCDHFRQCLAPTGVLTAGDTEQPPAVEKPKRGRPPKAKGDGAAKK